MNYAKLKQRLAPAPVVAFTGTWRAIEWQPDLFKPQRFIVGVLVEANDGQRAVRLMDAPGRIECFFRPAPVAQEFGWLMSNNRRTLAANGTLFGHNLSLSEPLFVQGADLQASADELFDEVVVAATPLPDAIRNENVGPDTDAVRRYVADELKRYWAILNEIAASAWVGGKQYSADAWHEFFKGKFIGYEETPDGRQIGISTTTLAVAEFGDYMTRVEVYAANDLGLEAI